MLAISVMLVRLVLYASAMPAFSRRVTLKRKHKVTAAVMEAKLRIPAGLGQDASHCRTLPFGSLIADHGPACYQ